MDSLWKEVRDRLIEGGIKNGAMEAKWLIAHTCGNYDTLMCYLQRRLSGEPLDYILGSCHFFGVNLNLNRHVLIPRPETEELAEKVGNKLHELKLNNKVLWDMCTGSGALAIALKRRFDRLNVCGSDICSEALALARENGKQNGVEVHWLLGDLFEPFAGQACDFFVANPPYISDDEFALLDPSVACFEPSLALKGGRDGLFFYRKIAAQLMHFLRPGGIAWLEIGKNQGHPVAALFLGAGFSHVEVQKDLAGHDRFVVVGNHV